MGKKKQKASNYGRGDFGGPSGHCRVSSPRGGHSDGQTFAEALREAGLSLRSIVADGNCLFRAAADQLYGNQSLHKKVRESAVSYMRSNEAEFACFTDTEEEPFPSYVRRMAKEGTWGGQLELQAISLAHKVNLLIYVAPEDLWGSKMGGGAVQAAPQGAPKGKAATGAEGRRPVGGPCWDIWKMQNFGPSAICLQLAFHSAMQHYSSVRLLGGQMGAPSSLTLAQLEAHSNQWTKAAPNTPQGLPGGAPEEDDTHILEGPPQEQSDREGGDPPGTLQPNNNSNDGSKCSSSNNSSSSKKNSSSSSEKEALLRSLCRAAAADMPVDCPLCLSCRRDAWRTGAIAAQVHALGPLGARAAFPSSSPSAAPSILAAEASKVSDAAAAAAPAPAAAAAKGAPTPPAGPFPIRHKGRSCLAEFWRCGRQPPGASEGPCSRRRRLSTSNSSSSNSSSSNSDSSKSSTNSSNSISTSNSSSSMGRKAGRIFSGSPWSVGVPIRKAFIAPLRPPLGSNEAEAYKHRNLPGSSSSTATAAAVLEGIFSIDSEILMLNNSQPRAAAGAAGAAAATAAPSPSPERGSRYSAAAGAAAAAAAAAASAEVAAADAATNVLAPLEVPMPCMAWGGPGLLRVEVPSPLCSSSSSSSSSSSRSSSSRRALSLPSLRIRLLPCARLWLTGEAAAAAAAMRAPHLSIPAEETRAPPANVQTGGAPAGSPGCMEDVDDALGAAAQQQQQQLLLQPRCKGRLSKREKNELQKKKKLQRELYRAERRREAAKSSSVGPSKNGGRGLSGEEGGPPESLGSIKKLAELTSRLLAV